MCNVVFNSEDAGRTWSNVSSLVGNEAFRKSDGLQRNPHDPKWVCAVFCLFVIEKVYMSMVV